MTDIRTCLQRLVEIWDEPGLRHEMPGAMWKAKEALKAEAERGALRLCSLVEGCLYPDCLLHTKQGARCGAKSHA